jgi:hypothetical protein
MSAQDHVLQAFEKAAHGNFGVLSTGEALAVAFILDRHDLLGKWTMLEAAERIGSDWLRAAKAVRYALPFDRIEQCSKQIRRREAA